MKSVNCRMVKSVNPDLIPPSAAIRSLFCQEDLSIYFRANTVD